MVWDWMAQHLAPLRLDEITIDEFCGQFNAEFEVDMDIDSDDIIISFLNTIKSYDHPQFTYVDTGKHLEAKAVIDAISLISTPAAGMSMR